MMSSNPNSLPLSKRLWELLSIAILIAGAAWIWISAGTFEGSTGGSIPAPKEGFLAPDFSLQAATGEAYRLSDLRGQVVLVNIWASWCSPCRQEMPAMQAAYETYKDSGFTILAVNATHQDSQTQASLLATELGLTFPILYDTEGEVSRKYQVHALPSSFFVDREGRIHEVVIGGPMAESLLRTRVENLLAGGE